MSHDFQRGGRALTFDDDTRLKLPLRWSLGIIVAVFVTGGVWTALGLNARQQEARISALEMKFEAQRDLLIDIHYYVKQNRKAAP
jgi:hypothetical protein